MELSDDRESKPRDESFYAKKAIDRHYFYVMDTRGQVFLEETMPRNIATCMKDIKFLDFLIRYTSHTIAKIFNITSSLQKYESK